MARFARVTQKIFAGSATNNGVFGSAQANAGPGTISSSISTIMGLSAWAAGWLSAVIGGSKFPPLEEFQGVQYVVTSQLAYLLQQGVPEYDSATTYYQNNIVAKAGTFQLYGSVTDNNTGNALSNPTYWQLLLDGSNSATTSGYVKLAGGIIIQWTSGTSNSSGHVSGSWPITFPTGVLKQIANVSGAGAVTSNYVTSGTAISTSSYDAWVNAASAGIAVNFIAIGN